jgi:hypothetical protein
MDQLKAIFDKIKSELSKRNKWNANLNYDDVGSVVSFLKSISQNALADKYEQVYNRIQNTQEVKDLRKQSAQQTKIAKDIDDSNYTDVKKPEYKRTAAIKSGPDVKNVKDIISTHSQTLDDLVNEKNKIEQKLESGSITLDVRKQLDKRLGQINKEIKDLHGTISGLKGQANIDRNVPNSEFKGDAERKGTPTQDLFYEAIVLANKFAIIGEELNEIEDPIEKRSRQRSLMTANYENEDKRYNKSGTDNDGEQATQLKYNVNSGNFKTLVNSIKTQLSKSTNNSLLDFSSNLNWSNSSMKPSEKFFTDASALYKLLSQGTVLNLSLGKELVNKAKEAADRLKSAVSINRGEKWNDYEDKSMELDHEAIMLRKIIDDLRSMAQTMKDRGADIEIEDYIKKIAAADSFDSVRKYISILNRKYSNEMDTDGHPMFKDIENRLKHSDDIRKSDIKIKHFFKKNADNYTADQITKLKRKYMGLVNGYDKLIKSETS